ncbi:hypothetical protein OVA24_16645 [Luteolibacter sp. SL250]|uniref:hypothetical protein n=1 Tax=Luteolibacter sp. SL250 TaxID=2995170 RepID=UPI002270AA29|nr:hypothetical protein [Luteolibacter sp. SL250]WAC18861.1 hypothetical protein OVA24_16645 [Luteolibacter sp. SL250]
MSAPAAFTVTGFRELGVRRLLQCASINRQLAREAKQAGNLRKRTYHLDVARRCRRDARELAAA